MRYSDTTILVPTINEADTIGSLIRQITSHYAGAKVMVIDDGSTDGTKSIVSRIAARNRNVSLHDRNERGRPKGLANSMIDGIYAASTKYVIFMDGDLQHPVWAIREISRNLKKGERIVIATRRKTQGQPFYRLTITKIFSVAGTTILYAKGSASSSDIFSGYFGLDRKYAKRIIEANRRRFVGQGYKFLFDLLKCIDRNTKIVEVPYVFKGRRYGSSKAQMRQGFALIKSFVT